MHNQHNFLLRFCVHLIKSNFIENNSFSLIYGITDRFIRFDTKIITPTKWDFYFIYNSEFPRYAIVTAVDVFRSVFSIIFSWLYDLTFLGYLVDRLSSRNPRRRCLFDPSIYIALFYPPVRFSMLSRRD